MAIILIVAVVFAGIGAAWASSKNLSPMTWGVICFFTGFVGLIILAFQKAVPASAANQ